MPHERLFQVSLERLGHLRPRILVLDNLPAFGPERLSPRRVVQQRDGLARERLRSVGEHEVAAVLDIEPLGPPPYGTRAVR